MLFKNEINVVVLVGCGSIVNHVIYSTELLMMYYWLSDFVGDEDGYWEEYLNMVLEK